MRRRIVQPKRFVRNTAPRDSLPFGVRPRARVALKRFVGFGSSFAFRFVKASPSNAPTSLNNLE